jgi:hypothetical protein
VSNRSSQFVVLLRDFTHFWAHAQIEFLIYTLQRRVAMAISLLIGLIWTLFFR